jgi:hypothetical protein
LHEEGFDDALMGFAERCGEPPLAVYDAAKVIEGYVKMGMSQDEAEEFFSFNTAGAWHGPNTPLFFYRCEDEDTD